MRIVSPTSHRSIEILAVRCYNLTSRQWSIYGSGVKTGGGKTWEVTWIYDGARIGK